VSAGHARLALRSTLAGCRPGLIGVVVLSVVLALLPVSAALYVLMVFDVVLVSHSGATLAGLTVLLFAILGMQVFLSGLRRRMLAQVGDWISADLGRKVDRHVAERRHRPAEATAVRRGLDAVRRFLSGPGAAAVLDAPAILFFCLVLIFFHALIALVLLVGAGVMAGLAIVAVRRGAGPVSVLDSALEERNSVVELSARHAELVGVLGMGPQTEAARLRAEGALVAAERRIGTLAVDRAELVRGVRFLTVAAALAVGAWLAIEGRASGGVIAAGSFVVAWALLPLETLVGETAGFAAARAGWRRVGQLLDTAQPGETPVPLPAPTERLDVEGLTLAIPEARRIVLREASFQLKAGEALAVIGPSGSGKTALLRGLTRGWTASSGKVRLDGAALDQWSEDALGRHLGYLPQEITLFQGSVAQNIARFDAAATSDQVIAAATAAGVHDLIVRLPQGYSTEVGGDGNLLSVGERQRIALARALYGDPFLLVLDEPAAYADGVAQPALAAAIRGALARGAIVVSTGNSQAVIETASKLAVIRAGRIEDFGPKDEVRARLVKKRDERPGPAATITTASASASGAPRPPVSQDQAQ